MKMPEGTPEQDGRVLLGEFLSPGVPNAKGMIPAILVDEANGLWYVSEGFMTELKNVYVNGVPKTLSTDTSGTFKKLGSADASQLTNWPYLQQGVPYTLIQENADPKTLDTSDIVTLDVVGPEQQGDASDDTTLLKKPCQMLRIALANFVYNEYPIGSPEPNAGQPAFFASQGADANTPVDDTTFDASDIELSQRNEDASIFLTSSTIPETLVKEWSDTFLTLVGWNTESKLAAVYLNLFEKEWTNNVSTVREDLGEIAENDSIGLESLTDEVVSCYQVSYIFNPALNGFAQTYTAEDAMVPVRKRRLVSLVMRHATSKAVF